MIVDNRVVVMISRRGNTALLVSAAIGDIGEDVIELEFIRPVVSADYETGVDVEVNGIPAVILGSYVTPSGYNIYYYLVDNIEIVDIVAWFYDHTIGIVKNMPTYTNISVTNYIGSHLRFDSKECSGHLVTIGV